MKKIISSILIVILFASSAGAFNITFRNTTDKTLIYRLYWLAPDWEDAPEAAVIAVGELKAGENNQVTNDYKPGPYVITWSNLFSADYRFNKVYRFIVEKKRCTIISTPETRPLIK